MKTASFFNKLISKLQNKSSPQAGLSATTSIHHSTSDTKAKKLPAFQLMKQIKSPVIVMVSIAGLTGLVSYRFYNQPELAVGTISPSKIVAPKDGEFIDHKSTEEEKKNIRNGSLKVYQENTRVSSNLKNDLREQLQEIERLRQLKNSTPQISTNILSTSVQNNLYQLPEFQWQEMLIAINSPEESSLIEDAQIRELLAYQEKVSPESFSQLISQLQSNRQKYQDIQNQSVQLSPKIILNY